ncbi:MAG: prepilin-type N-terminal cleavage/methylation domain-containing protein [Candidatus Woykebacteria bacterium]
MKTYLKSKKGQTLIEVLIALAVGAIFITAILGLATRSNRNANFARNQEQASKLGQQGIEIVRNIKALNDPRAIIPRKDGAPCNQLTNFNGLFECDLPDTPCGSHCDDPPLTNFVSTSDNYVNPSYGLRYAFHVSGDPTYLPALPCRTDEANIAPENIPASSSWCIHGNGDDQKDFLINIGGVTYTTGLFIADTPPVSKCNQNANFRHIKQFTIVVKWTDQAGTHRKSDVSCIGKKT